MSPISAPDQSVSSVSNRYALGLLAAIPIMMSLFNDNWLYTQVGWLDPWYNVAYFLHYSDPTFLNDYYKISRLSWIIPGYVIYLLFNPLVANYLLHVGSLFISSSALFLALRKLFNVEVAFVSSALLSVYVPFHGSGGWDYQTTPSGAYYLVAFALVTYAPFACAATMRLLFLVGLSMGAALHANILFINMVPLLLVQYLSVLYGRQLGKPTLLLVLNACAVVMAGILAITVLLGLINVLVGRDFVFFKVMFTIVTTYVADVGNMKQWWLPWSSMWFTTAAHFSYLTVPFAVTICGVLLLVWNILGGSKRDIVAISLVAQFIAAVALWLIWQTAGHVALQPNYFAYPLIPVMFAAIGGLAATGNGRSRQPKTASMVYMLPAFAVLLALPLIVNVALPSGSPRFIWAVIFFAALSTIACLLLRRFGWVVFFAAALLFGIGNHQTAVATGAQGTYAYRAPCNDARSLYQGLIDANRFLSGYVENVIKVYVWWQQGEVLDGGNGCKRELYQFGASMTSFGSHYLAPPWNGMPSIKDLPDTSFALQQGSFVAVPTSSENNIEELIKRYKAKGISLSLAGKTTIRTKPANFMLYLLAVRGPYPSTAGS
jgi:hypothetical protein